MRGFDFTVIGSSSGLEVRLEVSDAGWSVAIIENAAAFGIRTKVESIDWQFIVKRAFVEVDADAAMIERGNRQSENIEVFKGPGRFTGPKTLAVDIPGSDEEELTDETILIAAGTRPWAPEIPGLDQMPVCPQPVSDLYPET